MTSPYERLLSEELPTGTFGHALPPPEPEPRPITPWTAEEQAAHVAGLLDGINGWTYHEPEPEIPHLRLVDDQTEHTDTDAA